MDSGERSEANKTVKRNTYVVALLIFLVIALIGGLTYFILKDRGISLFYITEVEESVEVDQEKQVEEEEETKMGDFHVSFTYGASYLPVHKVCFHNVKDLTDVKCFIGEGIEETGEALEGVNSEVENELVDGRGSLPVGEYNMTYGEYGLLNNYVWNPCTRALNGNSEYDESVCDDFYTKLETAYDDNDFFNFKLGYVNSYGGDPIVIGIKEGETTEIGSVALYPYFQIDFMD